MANPALSAIAANNNPGKWEKALLPVEQLKSFTKYAKHFHQWLTIVELDNMRMDRKWNLFIATGGDNIEDLVVHQTAIEIRFQEQPGTRSRWTGSRRSPRPRTAKDADGPTREDTARRWATSATPVGKPAILRRYAGPRDQAPAEDKDEAEATRREEDAEAIPGEGPPTETMGRRRRRKRRSYGSR